MRHLSPSRGSGTVYCLPMQATYLPTPRHSFPSSEQFQKKLSALTITSLSTGLLTPTSNTHNDYNFRNYMAPVSNKRTNKMSNGKRDDSQEPLAARFAKRIKLSHDVPVTSSSVKLPAASLRIPFPEKVSNCHRYLSPSLGTLTALLIWY